MAGSGIDELVDSRKRESILGAHIIDIGEVNAHVPLACLLLDRYHVGEPHWILDFPNEPYGNELLGFLNCYKLMFAGKQLLFLLHCSPVRFMVR